MDPKQTKDGKPYGSKRFKEIIQERYFISKKCHTSYNDIGQISPLERQCLIDIILDEIEKERQAIEEVKNNKGTYKRI